MEFKSLIDKELQTEEVVITGEPSEIIAVLDFITKPQKETTISGDELAKELRMRCGTRGQVR